MKNDSLKFNISNLLYKILKNKNQNLNLKLSSNKNTSLNENLNSLNKINFKNNKNILKKLNYFDSYNQTKQNKELIKFKPINIKVLSDSSISKNRFLYSKYMSKTKLLNLILKSFKLLNKNLVLYVKKNGLNSILSILNQRKIKNIKTLNNINKEKFIKEFKHIKLKINNLYNNDYFNLIVPLKLKRKTSKELEKEIKIDKFIEETKTKNNFYLQVNKNNIFKNKNLIKFYNQNFLESTTSILNIKNFNEFNNFNKIKNKLIKNISFQRIEKEIIIKHINSKIIFNSNIAKLISSNNNYKFYRYNKFNIPTINIIYEFLHKSFISMSSLISKPVFVNTPDKIIIQLFYLFLNKNYATNINKFFRNNKNKFLRETNKLKYNQKEEQINKNFENNSKSIFILENKKNLNIICNILTRFFRKPIELELVRLYYPYYNSNILVNFFGIFINKIKLRRIIRRFIDKAVKSNYSKIFGFKNKFIFLPKKLSGIKIKVAGRLLTQRVIPRRTVKIVSVGALSKTKSTLIETARFTNKNKRGAFSVTISLGHRLYSTNINLLHIN
jgi:hypothetical protein